MLSPGTMSSWLFSPPFNADSRLSSRKCDFGFSGPWQRKQVFSKIGLTSRSKSACTLAEGGNLSSSTSAASEQLGVDRAVRRVANRTALAERFVFEHERPGLLAMALRAGLVQPRHGQSAVRFHDVAAVRVVTLDAVHPVFNHRMMLRQVE